MSVSLLISILYKMFIYSFIIFHIANHIFFTALHTVAAKTRNYFATVVFTKCAKYCRAQKFSLSNDVGRRDGGFRCEACCDDDTTRSVMAPLSPRPHCTGRIARTPRHQRSAAPAHAGNGRSPESVFCACSIKPETGRRDGSSVARLSLSSGVQ